MLSQRRTRKKSNFVPFSIHVRTGDTVLVLSGKDKGKTGTVRRVFNDRGRVVVEGVNIVKKAKRANPMGGDRGGIIEMEAPLAAAKLMLYCLQCSKPTRIKHDVSKDGKKFRVCHHCKAQFDQ